MKVSLDIAELIERFPDFRVGLVLARGLSIGAERPAALAAEIRVLEAEVAARHGEAPLSEIPEIQAWREAYRRFGVKKTSYRSSVERVVKSIRQGRGVPRINALVDCYNMVSARHLMPVGADDRARIEGALAFRYARPGDDFVRLGEEGAADPPRPGEVVYADRHHVLCRRWNWHQDARSAIGAGTRDAVLTVQCFADQATLDGAVADLCDRLARHCGAACVHNSASAARPMIELEHESG